MSLKILLTNDDGIYAEGLQALYRQLSEKYTVCVVAPDRERSAVSHAITLHEPLRVNQVSVNGFSGYAVSGTPVDCIKLGIDQLVENKPDMVISGINRGENVGVNINYSGTVAAAREAALHGCFGIAVSIQGFKAENYGSAAGFMEKLVGQIFENGLPFGTILNVNIPDRPQAEIAGVRFSRQSTFMKIEKFEKRTDPKKRTYYWYGEYIPQYYEKSDIDGNALLENYISVTPIQCDMTDYQALENLKKWNL